MSCGGCLRSQGFLSEAGRGGDLPLALCRCRLGNQVSQCRPVSGTPSPHSPLHRGSAKKPEQLSVSNLCSEAILSAPLIAFIGAPAGPREFPPLSGAGFSRPQASLSGRDSHFWLPSTSCGLCPALPSAARRSARTPGQARAPAVSREHDWPPVSMLISKEGAQVAT